MLRNATQLEGFVVQATDGELGTWLGGRRVLISPISVIHMDGQAKRADVRVTKEQVKNSPNIDMDKPYWLLGAKYKLSLSLSGV